jgi:hypothetical protein
MRRLILKGEAGVAAGRIYTLMTFGSTDFVASDFTVSGLPPGLRGVLKVESNSIILVIVGRL